MSNKGSRRPVLRDFVSVGTVTRYKHPQCFPILHARKVYFEGTFLMFILIHVTHWLLCETDEINTVFQSFIGYVYGGGGGGHRWILVLLLIFVDWYKHSNTNVSGSKCILNRFGCIIWRPKAILIKMSTLHNGLHDEFVLYIFPICIGFEFDIYRLFIVPNFKCIHAGEIRLTLCNLTIVA